MKAKLDDRIQTVVDLQSEFSDRTIPAGSIGIVVECYTSPEEAYGVDLIVPDSNLFGGADYESIILYADQFRVISEKKIIDEPLPRLR